ncbi:MAG: M28 family peptidase [Chloroflexota bacterium]
MNKRILLIIAALLALGGAAAYFLRDLTPAAPREFDGQRAYEDVLAQVSFGPRTPDSEGQRKLIEYLRAELQKANWIVEIQTAEFNGIPVRNVIARRSDVPPQVVLGAHYDTRLFADRDPDPAKQSQPVPGANDGASGVAVLLELARVLPHDSAPVWFVFFDAEDQGHIPPWEDWSIGARLFVEEFNLKPQAVVIVDMVGDPDLEMYMEKQSTPPLKREIWAVAAELGYERYFVPQTKYTIIDDHVPFLEAGIPAVDIIDMDYEYWHTTADTPDKVTQQSLQIVGEVLLEWLARQNR